LRNDWKLRKKINDLFNEIPKFRYEREKNENLLVVFNGHGGSGIWAYSMFGHIKVDKKIARSIKKLIDSMREEKWSEKDIEETVNRMRQENKTEKEIEEEVNNIRKKIKDGIRRWAEEDIKNTVEHITIDLSCCHSYKTAEMIKEELTKRRIEYSPQIVGEAGKEMVYGYSLSGDTGNLEYAINSYLESPSRSDSITEITLKDIFYSEIQSSNHTIFMVDDEIKGLIEEFIEYSKKNAGQSQSDVPKISYEKKRFLHVATIIPSSFIEKFIKRIENRHSSTKKRDSYYVELITIPTKILLKLLGLGKDSKLVKTTETGKKARNKIISLLEDWQIMLGKFFPVVRIVFVMMHEKQDRDKVNKGFDRVWKYAVANYGATVSENLKYAVPGTSVIRRIGAFIKLISNRNTRETFAEGHRKFNEGELDREEEEELQKQKKEKERIKNAINQADNKDAFIELLKDVTKYNDEQKEKIVNKIIDFVRKESDKNNKIQLLDKLLSQMDKILSGIDYIKNSDLRRMIFEEFMNMIKNDILLTEDEKIKFLGNLLEHFEEFNL
jgi:hypothetical protein